MKLYIAGHNDGLGSEEGGVAGREVSPEVEALTYANGLGLEYCRLISFYYPRMVEENISLKKEIMNGKK
ncbi:MAG: hypothetical protein WC302_00725 [Candidatus Paceibacterota bacterium]|jgi:hypothetical protein